VEDSVDRFPTLEEFRGGLIRSYLPEIIEGALQELGPSFLELRVSEKQVDMLRREALAEEGNVLQQTQRELDALRSARAKLYELERQQVKADVGRPRRVRERTPATPEDRYRDDYEDYRRGPALESGWAVRGRQWRREHVQLEVACARALDEWRSAAKERSILSFLRLRLYQIKDPGFSRKFEVFDTGGLSQTRAQDFLVGTDALSRFRRMFRQVDGGTVILVGPRGVGKTTILEVAGGLWDQGGRRGVVLVEGAPVEYNARDFALHMYGRLCEETIRAIDVLSPREGSRSSLARRLHLPVASWRLGVLTVLVAVGLLAVWLPIPSGRLIGVGALLLAIGLALLSSGWSPPSESVDLEIGDGEAVDINSLRKHAIERLGRIRFQQKYTSGWSGKVGLAGVEAASTRSREQTYQASNHPQILHEYRRFLLQVVEVFSGQLGRTPPPVTIAVDELDRLPRDTAHRFVAEVKAVLSPPIPGCLYLMSVSDEALADLDDATPSILVNSVDSVIRVERLNLVDAVELLQARVVGVPRPFLWMCFCLSGGLPRELIRIARTLLELRPGSTSSRDTDDLSVLGKRLVGEEIHRDPNVLARVVGLAASSEAAPSLRVLMRAERSEAGGQEIVALVRLAAERSRQMNSTHHSEACALSTAYFYATVLEVFGGGVDEERLKETEKLPATESLDVLAGTRSLLGRDPRLAWRRIQSFRMDWGLETLDEPRF
jgi:hypothetical protein